jgi:Ser/Thr protein kinase RdoA (MazF antagonist)
MAQSDSGAVGPRSVLDGLGLRASRIRRVAHRRNTHWIADTPGRRVVLRRYAPGRSQGEVAYELRLLERLERRAWPVPIPIAPVVEAAGSLWCAFRYLAGRAPAPRSVAGVRAEQRRRGRLLARLHADMADFVDVGQRDGWRRADEGLFDRAGKPPVDEVLAQRERQSPEEGRILRAYADRTRERLSALLPHAPAPVAIHGDLTPWNIRYARGTLSGVLDFDAAHLDLRVADFALSWRGRHDEVVRGYEEVSPLEPVERELLVPIYWAWIIASAVAGIEAGEASVDWAVTHLVRTEQARAERQARPRHPTLRSTGGA